MTVKQMHIAIDAMRNALTSGVRLTEDYRADTERTIAELKRQILKRKQGRVVDR